MSQILFSISPDSAQLAHNAAAFIETAVWSALAKRPDALVRVALSGGTTPYATLELLRARALPWERLQWLWVDERFVNSDHPRSNVGAARRALFDHLPQTHLGNVLVPPGPGEVADNLQLAADGYDAAVRTALASGPLDLVLLGIGDDGHTASLFPGAPELLEVERAVVAVLPREGREPRTSLTRRVLEDAHCTLLLAQGVGKQPALRALRAVRAEADVNAIPARILHTARGVVHCMTDAAALGFAESS